MNPYPTAPKTPPSYSETPSPQASGYQQQLSNPSQSLYPSQVPNAYSEQSTLLALNYYSHLPQNFQVPNVHPQASLIPNCYPQKGPTITKKYQIRQKIFSFGDNFEIKDERGETKFIVQAHVFSWGDKLVLGDPHGNPLYKIRQQLFHFLPQYNIISPSNDQVIAVLKRKLAFFKAKCAIASIYGDYELKGVDFWAHEFIIAKNEQIVATISKQYFTLSDTYGVEIVGTEDHAFILALVIVIDQILWDNKNN